MPGRCALLTGGVLQSSRWRFSRGVPRPRAVSARAGRPGVTRSLLGFWTTVGAVRGPISPGTGKARPVFSSASASLAWRLCTGPHGTPWAPFPSRLSGLLRCGKRGGAGAPPTLVGCRRAGCTAARAPVRTRGDVVPVSWASFGRGSDGTATGRVARTVTVTVPGAA